MVSIIVSFYERLAHLKSCLDSLALCADDFDEVVVTDDGSCSDTVDKLKQCIKRYDFQINHVWQPKRDSGLPQPVIMGSGAPVANI